jgi:hypothetical protein
MPVPNSSVDICPEANDGTRTESYYYERDAASFGCKSVLLSSASFFRNYLVQLLELMSSLPVSSATRLRVSPLNASTTSRPLISSVPLAIKADALSVLLRLARPSLLVEPSPRRRIPEPSRRVSGRGRSWRPSFWRASRGALLVDIFVLFALFWYHNQSFPISHFACTSQSSFHLLSG